ncbi:centriole, cilia and spindle-associated protein [Bufo bufo]|uniref:centriole, cilia and spindle-associated protein n=1 Tax=Bufo bufo TaxID=8384 RepID=UPI001ABE80EE|nr:centriole, cilia and spindle-associated protein [Bufo bufo]
MHCKTQRSEYMKRFKDPHWEAYRNCYEEMLKYRLSRRLLEHAHNPWLWDGWDGSSGSSSGRSTPPPKPCEPVSAAPKLQEPPTQQEEGTDARPSGLSNQAMPGEGQAGNSQDGEKNTESNEKSASLQAHHSHRFSSKQNARKLVSSSQKMSLTKESRHPFALYASGEREKDTGSQKTHNVCAPAQENEIHESALRAKNRRQKEKRKQMLQKQRARSADVERVLRRKPSPVDSPWMTEYMRCYSARAR